MTDSRGRVTVRYRVPSHAAHALRRGRDTLLVYEDRDRDGTHDHRPGRIGHESAAAIDIPVAMQINYVALGDSYSSGEAGRPGVPDFVGSDQTGESPADTHCRRWDKAYPVVLKNEFLGAAALNVGISFATFACTGAVTHNVYDPRGPSHDVTQQDLIDTNRPSHVVPSLRYDPDTNQPLLAPATGNPAKQCRWRMFSR